MPTLRLPDGRVLSWSEAGTVRGRPLVLLHGTPGSRVLPGLLGAAARDHGVRLILPDRPGFGRSDRDPGLAFAGYSVDLRALLDHLGLDRVTLAGFSGGGGYALAAADAMSDRLHAVLLVSGMVPGVPPRVLGGWSRLARGFESALARRLPVVLGWVIGTGLGGVARRGPRAVRLLLRGRSVGRIPGMAEALAADLVEALRQGPAATVGELRAYHACPATVPAGAAVEVLHSARDASVPVAVARWVAATVPDAALTVYPGAGHLFVFAQPELVLERVR